MADSIAGGISYTAPTFTWGQTNGTIGGGLNFDLPLASANTFTTQALTFSANNSQNTQNFLTSVINNAQSNVSAIANRSFAFQEASLDKTAAVAMGWQDIQRYAIRKAGKTGCFITTAICQSLGAGDKCWQLQVLRAFRDDYMLTDEKRAAFVQEYYDDAPTVVELLDALPHSSEVYRHMYYVYIVAVLDALAAADNERALELYQQMFEYAKAKAGV